MASCSEGTFLPTALAPNPRRRQQQQQQDSSELAIEHGQSRHTVMMMSATYTAFTSRVGLSSQEERKLARLAKALNSAPGTSTTSIASPSKPSLSGTEDCEDSYTSSTGLFFHVPEGTQAPHIPQDDDDHCHESGIDADDDESDWEDEDETTNDHLVFSRVTQPPTRSLASNLSLLLRQAHSGDAPQEQEPFSTGRTTLPNPLRCHPGLAAASSLTPESIMSPPMPPPPPPSSPCASVPLPSATTSVSNGSNGSYTSSSSAPSSSVGSASTSSASSSSGTTGSRALSAYPSRSASPAMRINQVSGLHAPLYIPFNGPGRHAICSGSGLLESELTGSLRESIMDENNSRYIFKHYGSRRYVEEGQEGQDGRDGEDGEGGPFASDHPAFRRTQSAPNIPHASRSRMSSLYMAGRVPLRRICYVDDYEAPKSWNWGMDYHAHGW